MKRNYGRGDRHKALRDMGAVPLGETTPYLDAELLKENLDSLLADALKNMPQVEVLQAIQASFRSLAAQYLLPDWALTPFNLTVQMLITVLQVSGEPREMAIRACQSAVDKVYPTPKTPNLKKFRSLPAAAVRQQIHGNLSCFMQKEKEDTTK